MWLSSSLILMSCFDWVQWNKKRQYLLKHPLGTLSAVHIWFKLKCDWVHFSPPLEHLMTWAYRIFFLEEVELILEYTPAAVWVEKLLICECSSSNKTMANMVNQVTDWHSKQKGVNVTCIQCIYETNFFWSLKIITSRHKEEVLFLIAWCRSPDSQ